MRLEVRLTHRRDCFAALPRRCFPLPPGGGSLVLRLHQWYNDDNLDEDESRRHSKDSIHSSRSSTSRVAEDSYLSWHGAFSGGDWMELPVAFARAVGLENASSVGVELVSCVSNARRVVVEPLSSDDWDVVDLYAGHLENQLLHQVCIVHEGQIVPIWVNEHNLVMLRVISAESYEAGGGHSVPCYRLTSGTEVEITPKPHAPPSTTSQMSPAAIWTSCAVALRIQPLPEDFGQCSVSCALVNPDTPALLRGRLTHGAETIFRVALSGPDGDNPSRAAAFRLVAHGGVQPNNIALTEMALRSMNACILNRVMVAAVAPAHASPRANLITLRRIEWIGRGRAAQTTITDERIEDSFCRWIQVEEQRAGGDALMWDGMQVDLGLELGLPAGCASFLVGVTLDSSEEDRGINFTLISSCAACSMQREGKIHVGNSATQEWPMDPFFSGPLLSEMGGVSLQTESALTHLDATLSPPVISLRLQLGSPPPGCLLVHGLRGAGRSAFCSAIMAHFRRNHYVYTHSVSCKQLLGLKMAELVSALEDAAKTCFDNIPSILFFDDLDSLAASQSEESGPAHGQSALIAEHLRRLLVSRPSSAAVMASAAESRGLQACLLRCGMFDATIELSPPGPEERADMLSKLAEGSPEDAPVIDWAAAGLATEGCRPSDLFKVMQRARHYNLLRQVHEAGSGSLCRRRCRLCQEDMDEAIKGYTPDGHASARLTTSTTRWCDVGGLESVRRGLVELFEMPVRYRRLLEHAPTRLPKGALLYGPPGCGKTLIAGAAACECGLSFISVKGPEVLDKYIGASEQAVRSLFARAQSAAPCLLFFDEFEAVAPRRGNDNTGVTDRVVNQLLTFLDGVEGLQGVYVMGATSRPDMIDPALLRPGRLDVQLYCGFPTSEERGKIATALSRKIPMSPQARSAIIEAAVSSEAASFSGADIQGLVNTAHLNAVHRTLLSAPTEQGEDGQEDTAVTIDVKDVKAAMSSTRPSMSDHDRAEYEAAYAKFSGARKAKFHPMSSTDDGTQRTALM